MPGGVQKKKQPDEVSKYGRLPGSTHTQMEFPIDEKVFDAETLMRPEVKQAVRTVDHSKDRDILEKNKKSWNAHTIVGHKPGEVRFPDPAMKAQNSKFTSIREYEYNYRSEYLPKFNAPIATKCDRRSLGLMDARDSDRVFKDGRCEWTNDAGEQKWTAEQANSRVRGEMPVTALKDKQWDKPQWNVSVSTETLEDKIERDSIQAMKDKKAFKASAKKNKDITTTRMGLLHRHNSVAAAIREAKTEARAAPKIPKSLPPTIAAVRRMERQTKTHEHSGTWEMNPVEGRMMWSDTGSYDFDSRGDSVKIKTHGAWTFAAPS